jgi:hypothetical protein
MHRTGNTNPNQCHDVPSLSLNHAALAPPAVMAPAALLDDLQRDSHCGLCVAQIALPIGRRDGDHESTHHGDTIMVHGIEVWTAAQGSTFECPHDLVVPPRRHVGHVAGVRTRRVKVAGLSYLCGWAEMGGFSHSSLGPDDMDTISKAGFGVGALFEFVALALRGVLHRSALQSARPEAQESPDFLDTEPAVHSGL